MTVGEICYGRGTPMSLFELAVGWRAFYMEKARLGEQAEKRREMEGRRLR